MELAETTPDVRSDDWSETLEALDGHLQEGEQLESTAGTLQRVALQFFDRCQLVLTDRRLIVLKPSWPWGFRFEADYPREACRITKVKPRVDGSTLVVIGHAGEDLCFYVPRRSRDGGIAIMEALR